MSASVHLLLGFPGTGKYTVAKAMVAELERRGETVKLVDAHYVNNPVFGLIHQDGMTPLPAAVWPIVRRVREALMDAIEELSPPEYSFIFTNFVTQEEVQGPVATYFERLHRLAESKGGQLHITRLTCETDELCRRIVGSDRVARLKMTNAEKVRALSKSHRIYEPPDGSALTLDVTELAPSDAALRILEHAG